MGSKGKNGSKLKLLVENVVMSSKTYGYPLVMILGRSEFSRKGKQNSEFLSQLNTLDIYKFLETPIKVNTIKLFEPQPKTDQA